MEPDVIDGARSTACQKWCDICQCGDTSNDNEAGGWGEGWDGPLAVARRLLIQTRAGTDRQTDGRTADRRVGRRATGQTVRRELGTAALASPDA